MLLRTILTAENHKVAGEAINGESGVEMAIKMKPDIICLDILMPDGSGIDVLKQIMERLPKTIVLMVTGTRDATTIKECLANGAQGFVIKPFNAATVIKTVDESIFRASQKKTVPKLDSGSI